MNKDLENHMVTPYHDDDPIDEPKEQDPDGAYDAWRASLSDKEYDDYRLGRGEYAIHSSDNMRIDSLAAKLLREELIRIARSQK